MKDILFKFLNIYFFQGKNIISPKNDLVFSNTEKIKKVLVIYLWITFIYLFSLWFGIDFKNTYFYIWIYILNFLSIIFGGFYILTFFLWNNKVPKVRWIFYFLIILSLGVVYLKLNSWGYFFEYFLYYFFYIWWVVLLFVLLPLLYYFISNFKFCLYIWWGVTLFFLKGFFISLDIHNIKRIIENMPIERSITKTLIREHTDKLKNRFRIIWGWLVIFTTGNLIWGYSVYSLYNDYFLPFITNISIYINSIESWSKGVFILLNVISLIILYLLIIFSIYFVLYAFFLHLEICFFDLLEEKVNKNNLQIVKKKIWRIKKK